MQGSFHVWKLPNYFKENRESRSRSPKSMITKRPYYLHSGFWTRRDDLCPRFHSIGTIEKPMITAWGQFLLKSVSLLHLLQQYWHWLMLRHFSFSFYNSSALNELQNHHLPSQSAETHANFIEGLWMTFCSVLFMWQTSKLLWEAQFNLVIDSLLMDLFLFNFYLLLLPSKQQIRSSHTLGTWSWILLQLSAQS